MTPLITPILLGLAASLHCVGMCGPLMLALPLDAAGKRHLLRQMLTYHGGRILTYSALGVVFGLLGKGLMLAGFQKGLSIGAGIFMLAMAFTAWRFEQLVTNLPGFGRFTQQVKSGIGNLMRQNAGSAVFGVGLLNGLLPCGMVYAALAGAITTSGSAEGGLFMALFGLGTLPLMLAVSVLGRSFSLSIRQKIRIAQPILLTLAGLLLLQRGMHLDLSLFESAVPKAGYECH
ncbi:MAG TPA: sulfite exporter TauE/SafE family protein [Saprospiraceae bacterium]|nr:sulfite exporter TauE/SafE family protein [Saprospiraceae bacterium]